MRMCACVKRTSALGQEAPAQLSWSKLAGQEQEVPPQCQNARRVATTDYTYAVSCRRSRRWRTERTSSTPPSLNTETLHAIEAGAQQLAAAPLIVHHTHQTSEEALQDD